MQRRQFLSVLTFCAVMGPWAPATAGRVLLSVQGEVAGDGPVHFDADALDALPRHEIVTGTEWTDGVETFAGPALADVLAAAGAGPGDLRLTALNDYSVDMPRRAVAPEVPIVALYRDGTRFGVRDHGPLWIIFPYDRAARYRNEQIFSYSIWQLARIDVKPG